MSEKWHIGRSGVPKLCKARKRSCPIGGEHFTDYNEATKASLRVGGANLPKFSKEKKDESFSDKAWRIADTVEDKAFGENPGFARTMGVLLGGGAVVTGALAAPLVAGAVIHSNNAHNAYNTTPYSVSATVRDGNHLQFTGRVKSDKLQESYFKECNASSKNNGYVVCKTTDGKYTVTAKTEENHSKHRSWVELSRVQVKDNANGSVHNLSHKLSGSDTNIYIPKNSN